MTLTSLHHQLLDRLELFGPGAAEQLEDRRLDGGQQRAAALHLAQPQFAIGGGARADRVDRDVDLDAAPEQVVDRLADADVRLDPADERLVTAGEVEALSLCSG